MLYNILDERSENMITIGDEVIPKNSLECKWCKAGYCKRSNNRFCSGAVRLPEWCPLVQNSNATEKSDNG